MSNQTYSGWSNKQTWNINLMYGETFATMAEEQKYDDVEHMADSFEALINEIEVDVLNEGSTGATAFAKQCVGEYLDAVDWMEIASHFYEEESEEKDEDDEKLTTYLQAFTSYEEAKSFCDSLINGGIIQQQDNQWHVWQVNFTSLAD